MIKSFLNLCLLLFLDILAHMVAIAAAIGVAWAAVCCARWAYRKFTASVTARRAQLARKEPYASETR